jgi:hypothetical protein
MSKGGNDSPLHTHMFLTYHILAESLVRRKSAG